MPLLAWAIYSVPSGLVLEHGCGPYSSPFLDQFCRDAKLERHVIEADDRYASRFMLSGVRFRSLDDWLAAGRSPALCLVDGDAAERQRLVSLLLGHGCRLVVHDAESDFYKYDFRGYTVVREDQGPPKTVVLA